MQQDKQAGQGNDKPYYPWNLHLQMAHTSTSNWKGTFTSGNQKEDGFEDKKRTVGWGHIECPRVPYSVVPKVCTQLQLSSGWVEHSNESERAPLK